MVNPRTTIPVLAVLATLGWGAHSAARPRVAPVRIDKGRQPDAPPAEPHDAFKLGALGGIGFPRPLAIEGIVKMGDWVGLGGEYSALPRSAIGGVDLALRSFAGDLRVFPFRNAFFLGLRGGHQRLDMATAVVVGGLDSVPTSATVETWFLNPRLGLLYTSGIGLTIGTEIGLQVPVSTAFSTTAPPEYAGMVAGNAAIKLFGGTLPTLDLLRVGALF